MDKKLILAAALVFGVTGLMLAQGNLKAQDTNDADNSIVNSDNSAMNADNSTAPAAQKGAW